MTMLRDISWVSDGKIDSTDARVGVLAGEIPTGFSPPAFLLNDIDSAYPNRLYAIEILTFPSNGTLYLDKAGVGSFSGASLGSYTGTQRVKKYDLGIGLISDSIGPYIIQIDPVPANVIGVSITPTSMVIPGGSTYKFNAVALGTNNPPQTFIWETTLGGIDDEGNVTAPTTTSFNQTGVITATSTLDPTKKGSATFTVPSAIAVENPPEVRNVTISPSSLFLLGGTSYQFNAVVTGTGAVSQEVDWSIDKGSINANGVAVMPNAVYGQQFVIITATSKQNPAKKTSVTVTVQSLGEIDPASIVLPPSRVLRTSADDWKIREGYVHTEADTFQLRQGYWTIVKDIDDSLFYGMDIRPYLATVEAGIADVVGLPKGITVLMKPFVRDGLIIVKVGGGDPSDSVDAVNCLTFRIVCSNGENFDRTIYFALREN